MSRLDDEAGTRILGQKTVIRTWFLDFACRKCQRFGCVEVQLTGGPIGPDNKPTPKTSHEEMREKVRWAHEKGNLCIERTRDILVGRLWRWQVDRAHQVRTKVFLQLKGDTEKTQYRWPPWAGR